MEKHGNRQERIQCELSLGVAGPYFILLIMLFGMPHQVEIVSWGKVEI